VASAAGGLVGAVVVAAGELQPIRSTARPRLGNKRSITPIVPETEPATRETPDLRCHRL
jgi:hypothetical protein